MRIYQYACIYINKKAKEKDRQKDLPIMHWLPKMHKTPADFRFVVASK